MLLFLLLGGIGWWLADAVGAMAGLLIAAIIVILFYMEEFKIAQEGRRAEAQFIKDGE